jgi:hypothetical protein
MSDQPARSDVEFTLTTVEKGKVTMRLVDRINVDDVYLHLVHREIYRLVSGDDPGNEVNQLFKDFLLKERFTMGRG